MIEAITLTATTALACAGIVALGALLGTQRPEDKPQVVQLAGDTAEQRAEREARYGHYFRD